MNRKFQIIKLDKSVHSINTHLDSTGAPLKNPLVHVVQILLALLPQNGAALRMPKTFKEPTPGPLDHSHLLSEIPENTILTLSLGNLGVIDL